MKKMLLVVLCIVLVLSMTACGEGKKAQEIYDSFGTMDFDESLLNDNELTKIASFKDEREKLLKEKNINGLEKLKEEWDEFSTPLNNIIEQYKSTYNQLISDNDKSLLTDDELQDNNKIVSKIDIAFKNRNANALSEATGEYIEHFQNTKEVFNTYHNIEKPFFSDKEKSILPDNDINTMQDLSDKTENALKDRDLQQMKSVQNEWISFTATANTDLESAKHKMLNDWILNANLGASIGNILSFGITTSSTTIENHTIVYTTKYNVENYGSDEQVEASLNSYINLTSAVYQSGVKQLKPYINDICIRVEYLRKDDSVICYKEFN